MHTTTAQGPTHLTAALLIGWWTTGDRALVQLGDGRHLTVPVADDFEEELTPGRYFLVELEDDTPVALRGCG